MDAATARQLLVADRQFILLKLREATFGEHVQGSVPCPWPDCGKRLTLRFSTRDVPVVTTAEKGLVHTLVLSLEAMPGADEAERTITFRLPNGGDQEALSPLLAQNEARALTGLLVRCLLRIGSDILSVFFPPLRLDYPSLCSSLEYHYRRERNQGTYTVASCAKVVQKKLTASVGQQMVSRGLAEHFAASFIVAGRELPAVRGGVWAADLAVLRMAK